MTATDGEARNTPLRPKCAGRTRLVLVEDHAILRDGLTSLLGLESDVSIVGAFDCLESSLEGIRQLQPEDRRAHV